MSESPGCDGHKADGLGIQDTSDLPKPADPTHNAGEAQHENRQGEEVPAPVTPSQRRSHKQLHTSTLYISGLHHRVTKLHLEKLMHGKTRDG